MINNRFTVVTDSTTKTADQSYDVLILSNLLTLLYTLCGQ